MKSPSECCNIDDIREAIDSIDQQIMELLSYRFEYVKEIVKYKKPDKNSIIAKDRYDRVLKKRREMAEQYGLNPEVIEDIYKRLIRYFIEEEIKLVDDKNNNSE